MIERIKSLILPILGESFIEVRELERDGNNITFLVMVEEDDFENVKGKNGKLIKAISKLVDFSNKNIKIKLEAF